VLVAVINGVAAAPFIVITMFVSSSRRIMGEYANGLIARALGWLTALLMSIAAVALFATGGI
jgi:Mn2+/Fe2+ NRAMP family transporter